MSDKLMLPLRSRGIDVLTVDEAGMRGQTDVEQLRFATAQGRVLFSFNVAHYLRLHSMWIASGEHHAGIALAQQQRYSLREQLRRLTHLVSTLDAAAMRDRVEFLSAW